MKKKIFGGIAVLAIAALATFNLNMNIETNNVSLLTLVDIEALAGEIEPGITCDGGGYGKCYKMTSTTRPDNPTRCDLKCKASGDPKDSCSRFQEVVATICSGFGGS